MNNIQSLDSAIYFGASAYKAINNLLAAKLYSRIFILVDDNTITHCYPHFCSQLATETPIEVIQISAGELHKNIETCSGVWETLAELDADRNSLLISLGGGVVTDLGGFVAATYNRGIAHINVPTTLLAMVDASVGGKTGVDLGQLKNKIGVFSTAEMVLIDTQYLQTLPARQMRSGLAEMLKHGLIQSAKHWYNMTDLSQLSSDDLEGLIYESITIKNKIVIKDPKEQGVRKTLNFGHTLGHAIESYYLDSNNPLLHGESVAIGMILASYISTKTVELDNDICRLIKNGISQHFEKVTISENKITGIIDLLKFDKKNSHGQVNFVLLKGIEQPVINQQIPTSLIHEAFAYYHE